MSDTSARYYDKTAEPLGGLLWATGQGDGSIVARALVRSMASTTSTESVSKGDVVFLLPMYDTQYSERGFFICTKSFVATAPDYNNYGTVILGVVKPRELIKGNDKGAYNTWVDVVIRGEVQAYCVATTTSNGTGGTFVAKEPLGAVFTGPTGGFRGVLTKLHATTSYPIPHCHVATAIGTLTTTTGTQLSGKVLKTVWFDGLYKTPINTGIIGL